MVRPIYSQKVSKQIVYWDLDKPMTKLNLNEIIKGLPESMLEDDEGDSIVKRFVPTMFVNRYKTAEDERMKQISKRNWE